MSHPYVVLKIIINCVNLMRTDLHVHEHKIACTCTGFKCVSFNVKR